MDSQINFERNRLERFLRFEPRLATNGNLEVIVKYSGDITDIPNVTVEILNCNYAIITGKTSDIALLYSDPRIEYIELPKAMSYELTSGLNSSCITRVKQEPYFLTGKGTAIAIIDSGIDYTNEDFIDENGNSRIICAWDQTTEGRHPIGFSFGAEYTNEDFNFALRSDSPLSVLPFFDYSGHGTAVAGVACGNGRQNGGREQGVAPEAGIIAVKLGQNTDDDFAKSTQIMRALRYVNNKAREFMLPLAINLSYGTNNGGHDGNSLFESFVDELSDEWKSVMCVATGNEASSGHHFSAQIGDGDRIDIDFRISTGRNRLYMTLWKNFADEMTFSLISPNGEISLEMTQENRLYLFTLDGIDITVFFERPSSYSVSQEIYFLFEAQSGNIPDGLWQLFVSGKSTVDGRIDAWLPTTENASEQTAFLTPDPFTTLTLPSTAQNVISVGAYNSNDNTAASFSGRGYTRENVYVKPDIVAPGVNVLSVKRGGGYDVFTGTSISCPFVTGACALLLEWGIVRENDVFLYGQKIKAFLRKGAKRNDSSDYPDRRLGYGKLCLSATLNELIRYNGGGSVL